MNYKKLNKRIKNLEEKFYKELNDFEYNTEGLHLKENKIYLVKKWKNIGVIFRDLRKIILIKNYNIFSNNYYNNFIIKRYATITYYNFCYEIQKKFKDNEDFIRDYLDEKYSNNYSKIARFIYNKNFIYNLNFPKEFVYLIKNKIDPELHILIEKNADYNFKIKFTYKNFYYYFRRRFNKVLHFFVKNIGLFLSEIKIKFLDKGEIGIEEINVFLKKVKPGDILLTRQNYVATNIGIPGFWKHMAMYVGTGEYIKNNFKSKKIGNLEENSHYIIESTSKGVCLEKVEDFIKPLAYLGVIRTTFSEAKILRVIKTVILLLNKEYDYLFNYNSDKNFVCSELITKAYLKENKNDEGLNIELIKVATGLSFPPNDLIKKLKNENNLKNKEIFEILFIDKKNNKNFVNENKSEFFESYKRSRFSFFQK